MDVTSYFSEKRSFWVIYEWYYKPIIWTTYRKCFFSNFHVIAKISSGDSCFQTRHPTGWGDHDLQVVTKSRRRQWCHRSDYQKIGKYDDFFNYNVIRTLQPWSAVPLPSHTNSINGISVSDLVFIWNPGILDGGTPPSHRICYPSIMAHISSSGGRMTGPHCISTIRNLFKTKTVGICPAATLLCKN